MKRLLFGLAACMMAARADDIQYAVSYVGDNSDNTVATTSFSLAKTLWGRSLILLNVVLDQTTVPPLTDAVTGASRPQRQSHTEFRKNRGQIIAGVEQGLGADTRILASYYFSQEVDYQSQAVIGGLARDFLQKNFTVALRAQYTLDSVGEILADGSIRNRGKETHQGSLILTQLLSPNAVLQGGADIMRNHGFLSDPYRKIAVPGANPLVDDTVTERHPSMRYRYAAWSEISQYLRGIDGAFIVHYRYYQDDWGLVSHTASLAFNKYITKNLILSPKYRYYDQSGADFREYGDLKVYDAADYKLRIIGSNMAGLGTMFFLRAFSRNHPTWDFLNHSSVSAVYEHYFEDAGADGYSANVMEASLKFTF